MFEDLDRDRNGSIDIQEFAVGLKRINMSPKVRVQSEYFTNL